MNRILLLVMVIVLLASTSCMMPNVKKAIAANEIKLAEEGYTALSRGDVAPEFVTLDQAGDNFDVASAIADGPIVLYFYPANETPNSTKQLRQLSNLNIKLKDSGLFRIYAISTASSSETNKYFADHEIDLPFLTDTDMEIAEQYGCASTSKKSRLPERTVVGIDAAGNVAFYQRRFFEKSPSEKLLKSPAYFDIAEPSE